MRSCPYRSRSRGYPNTIRADDGTAVISRNLDLWAHAKGVTLDFSRLEMPTDNGLSRLSTASVVNVHWFMGLADAGEELEDWRGHYNDDRPHSAIVTKVESAGVR